MSCRSLRIEAAAVYVGEKWKRPALSANFDLSQDYLKAGGGFAEIRVVQAGYRLGAVLKRIVAEERTAAFVRWQG